MVMPLKERAHGLGGVSILLVEDDDVLARTLTRSLSARGFSMRTADTVEQAQAALREQLPDLILLDIDLPDGSGWDVLRALRAAGGASTPVIVISALQPNPRLVRELGCFAVLEKPFPIESLVRLVETELGEPVVEGRLSETVLTSREEEIHE